MPGFNAFKKMVRRQENYYTLQQDQIQTSLHSQTFSGPFFQGNFTINNKDYYTLRRDLTHTKKKKTGANTKKGGIGV